MTEGCLAYPDAKKECTELYEIKGCSKAAKDAINKNDENLVALGPVPPEEKSIRQEVKSIWEEYSKRCLLQVECAKKLLDKI